MDRCSPVQERHPDHGAASELLTKAVFYAALRNYAPHTGAAHTVAQVVYYQMRYQFRPSFVVDISDHYEQKLAAVRAHASQLGLDAEPNLPGTELAANTLISSPLMLHSIEARDSYCGCLIGCRYGEAFVTHNTLPIANPVDFFTRHPGNQTFFFPEAI